MKKHSLEVYEGYIITGPEYVTLFDCATGDELDTTDYYFGREDDLFSLIYIFFTNYFISKYSAILL